MRRVTIASGVVVFAIAYGVLTSIGGVTHVGLQDSLFVRVSSLVVGRGPGDLVFLDINRDGHLDLVTQHLLERVVNVHLGDGRGHFSAPPDGPMNLGYEPGAIALGDVNGDGLPDLAVASRDLKKEYVQVFIGEGNGRFRPAPGSLYTTSASVEFYKPFVRIVDLNEDGKPDIVTSNGRRNSLEMLLGDGRGEFSTGPALTLEAGHDFYSFALGDVDGDRHVDIVIASAGGASDHLVVASGDGRGNFHYGAASLPVSAGPRVVELADVNGDRAVDVVLSHATRANVSVLLNTGYGIFVLTPTSPYEVVAESFAAVVADANGDKRPDILAATANSVTVLLGNGKAFVSAPGSPFGTGPGAYRLAIGDVNEDGRLDVAASSFEGDSVTLLLGRQR